jgi:hypothetical protein
VPTAEGRDRWGSAMAAEEDDGAKQDGDRKDWEGIAKLWGMHDRLLWLPRGAQRVVSLTGPFSSRVAPIQPGPC